MEFQAFDAAYLDRLCRRDAATEQHFVSYFSELIALKVRSRLQSRELANDVAQETFARVFALIRQEGGVRQGDRLGALVNSICNNVLFEQYRQGKRSEPLDDKVAATLLDQQPDALHHTIAEQTRAGVHEVLNALSKRDGKVLKTLFVEERDKDSVCREMGIDREYLRVLVHRAKKAFRERVEGKLDLPKSMSQHKPM